MAEVILMPRLSDTMTEGVIEAWNKKVGDKVKSGDVLAEVQTDKATMDLESYEQFHLDEEHVGDQGQWLTDGASLRSVLFNGAVSGIELPQFMEFDIESTEPAVRGDTASGRVMKDAVLPTGAVVKVPLYMEAGERILVSTQTGEFVKRVTAK